MIWFIGFSGIEWKTDHLFVSLYNSLIEVAKIWGPLFAPSALIIYMISMFKRNLAYEISENVSLKMKETIKDEVKKQSRKQTEHGIKAVYYGFKNNEKFTSQELYMMQCRSIRNYHSKFLTETL